MTYSVQLYYHTFQQTPSPNKRQAPANARPQSPFPRCRCISTLIAFCTQLVVLEWRVLSGYTTLASRARKMPAGQCPDCGYSSALGDCYCLRSLSDEARDLCCAARRLQYMQPVQHPTRKCRAARGRACRLALRRNTPSQVAPSAELSV